jgi:electron transport complex protein RnfD
VVFALSAVFGRDPVDAILSGGLMLGAIFMATDYVTTPMMFWGRVIFAVGAGFFTVVIRVFGSYPEGVSFSILLMNILTPYINRFTISKPLGGIRE